MIERPIIFSGLDVRAILAGRKTQARRIVKQQPEIDGVEALWYDYRADLWRKMDQFERDCCPFGAPGDRLWVKETWNALNGGSYDEQRPPRPGCCELRYRATDEMAACSEEIRGYRWRPPLHMPRWASRITLGVTDVRVQRLQEISADDVAAEGTPGMVGGRYQCKRCNGQGHTISEPLCSACGGRRDDPRGYFAVAWDAANAKRAPWASDPWVWAIAFRRLPESRG